MTLIILLMKSYLHLTWEVKRVMSDQRLIDAKLRATVAEIVEFISVLVMLQKQQWLAEVGVHCSSSIRTGFAIVVPVNGKCKDEFD